MLIASSDIITWIIVQKWTRYEFGLGQGILGMKSGKRSSLQLIMKKAHQNTYEAAGDTAVSSSENKYIKSPAVKFSLIVLVFFALGFFIYSNTLVGFEVGVQIMNFQKRVLHSVSQVRGFAPIGMME